MLHFITHLFKRKTKREYLYDEFRPHKSSIIIWLQRLILLIALVIIGTFVLTLNTLANASENMQMPYVNMKNINQGSLLFKSQTPGQFQQLPLLHTDVNMHISGMIARSSIKQRFENISNDYIEAIYVFPLPETAAVDHMRMLIGERVIEGQIKEKQDAKRIYEKARRAGKKSALIEQERANLFTNSVANIAPGEIVEIEIEYQQVLQFDQGDFSLRFPMAITPRYIPGEPVNESISIRGNGWAQNTNQVIDASRISPPVFSQSISEDNISKNDNLSDKNILNPVSINIELDSGFPLKSVFSRYHSIEKTINHEGITTINLTTDNIASDRDFELVWTPDPGYTPKAALFAETIGNDHYQLLMMLPPDNQLDNDQPLARDVTYIIDTSGSMHGISIEQAKNSLLMALDRLRLHDRFNIIQFNSVTDQLFYDSKLASFKNILLAKQFVQQLEANGGTEMAPALKLALNNTDHKDFVHQVVFLTDGSVGNESALFDIINRHLGNSRLFTVGIGSAPNSYFMRKAAQFGRGTFTYISDVSEVSQKMTSLFKKLESPLMTNLTIDFGDADFDTAINAEIWPTRIPDLYHGEPVILAIKSDAPLQNVSLQGVRALSPWSATLNMTQGKSSNGIATFWARNKIAALMDSLHENTGDASKKSKTRKDIVNIALKHHLVSKYTSLVAVDKTPVRDFDTPLNKQTLAVNLPHGQSTSVTTQKVFGRLPQTATSAEMKFFFGCSLLILGLLSQLIHQPLFRKKLKHWRLL